MKKLLSFTLYNIPVLWMFIYGYQSNETLFYLSYFIYWLVSFVAILSFIIISKEDLYTIGIKKGSLHPIWLYIIFINDLLIASMFAYLDFYFLAISYLFVLTQSYHLISAQIWLYRHESEI